MRCATCVARVDADVERLQDEIYAMPARRSTSARRSSWAGSSSTSSGCRTAAEQDRLRDGRRSAARARAQFSDRGQSARIPRSLEAQEHLHRRAAGILVDPRDRPLAHVFNQTTTATGRLSSTNPNLQNIPVRSEIGRQIRRAFVAGSADRVLLAADYSQIELRLMAHLSGDEAMREAFLGPSGHPRFHRAPDLRDRAVRRRDAQPAPDGEERELRLALRHVGLRSRAAARDRPRQARAITEAYFARFPGVRGYIDRCLEEGRERGYVQTLLGRRRYMPDLRSATSRCARRPNARRPTRRCKAAPPTS
jgi:hypothetical protein